MIAETVLITGLCLVGAAVVAGALYLTRGKAPTTILWIKVSPGILVLCICLFILGKFGAYHYTALGLCVGMGLLVMGGVFTLFVEQAMNPLTRVIEQIAGGTDQIVVASGQLLLSSQSLSDGANEQASSIEETSSSLEEMASMTQQNVGHSKEAMSLVGRSMEKLKEANGLMKSLIESMENTSAASDDVSKIIKTIDQIAFQTNLLALNAAVEAARAGEAGAGFSVVAEEVRNLAMRSSEASLSTQELITDVIKKIEAGTGLVERTDDCYREVAINVQKTNNLMDEIVSASQEQAQGIEQINTAVAEIDKVTQQNAANAEESASASRQMSVQAQKMRDLVEGTAGVGADAGHLGGGGAGFARTVRQAVIPRMFGQKGEKVLLKIAHGK